MKKTGGMKKEKPVAPSYQEPMRPKKPNTTADKGKKQPNKRK